eukprot:CAMPEP_0196655020 /NCGR_PEP_ID=MMETSP1086-20130531/4774_1 /TAXON_ID=77921 /ORGANISM="Cyanoptyche  gloeocystis , Strain SAG4.97" /LENGTH=315 /DNA_ID=CAMNT_0041987109 /DNA_START=324 /DNA_END=1270 /DNA_ORIENTATION=+
MPKTRDRCVYDIRQTQRRDWATWGRGKLETKRRADMCRAVGHTVEGRAGVVGMVRTGHLGTATWCTEHCGSGEDVFLIVGWHERDGEPWVRTLQVGDGRRVIVASGAPCPMPNLDAEVIAAGGEGDIGRGEGEGADVLGMTALQSRDVGGGAGVPGEDVVRPLVRAHHVLLVVREHCLRAALLLGVARVLLQHFPCCTVPEADGGVLAVGEQVLAVARPAHRPHFEAGVGLGDGVDALAADAVPDLDLPVLRARRVHAAVWRVPHVVDGAVVEVLAGGGGVALDALEGGEVVQPDHVVLSAGQQVLPRRMHPDRP